MTSRLRNATPFFMLALCLFYAATTYAQTRITTPKEEFGYNFGDDYFLANYRQIAAYWHKLDRESDRMIVQEIGKTAEGRPHLMAIVTSPENHRNLARYREISRRLALAEGLTDDQGRQLAKEGKAVVWIDGGLHATETLGAQQLGEMVYQMVSRNDEETLHLLNDVIILFVHANPDGNDLVADWYMRNPAPEQRSLAGLPRLYQKYIGHDNNRDFFASTQAETENINRVLYHEWFPQILYNHHQSGPAGTVLWSPPLRDPFNYNLDPILVLGLQSLGIAMHTRLAVEGKPGATMRSGGPYDGWWNGGIRNTGAFHNIIALLTETIGSPTPMRIPLVMQRQLPSSDLAFPVAPQEWHFRQSVEYMISLNRAVLDYASRMKENLLFNIYRMGRNSIERGSRDNWTANPKRYAEVAAKMASAQTASASGVRGAANAERDAAYWAELRKPEFRDPRGFIIPSDQPDFPTATKFINALLETVITVHRATRAFEVSGKKYPAGSYVVFLMDRRVNNAFIAVNRLLKSGEDVYWLQGATAANGQSYPAGAFYVAAKSSTRAALDKIAVEHGVSFDATTVKTPADAMKLRQPRSGLWDQYGGSMESGWARWILEQFEFPFERVFAPALDAGDLNSRFDVLIFVGGGIPGPGGGGRRRGPVEPPQDVPAEYQSQVGRVTVEKTLPRIREFIENGGAVIAIGESSANLAAYLQLPLENHLLEDGRPLPQTKYYVPGSVLSARVDAAHPVAHGMAERADLFFDNSPVFKLGGENVKSIAWFDTKAPLRSGWAWGQQYLENGIVAVEVRIGKGKAILFGPEILKRAQPHGTFKLLFNGIYYGVAN